jgi:hypothetical protein
MRKIVATILILSTAGMVVFFNSAGRRTSVASPKVTVTFLGYTNSVASGLQARFAVTNASPGPVIRHVGYRLQVPAKSPGRWNVLSRGWFGNQGDLNSGAGEVLLAPVPTNAPSWRLSLTVLRNQRLWGTAKLLAFEAKRLLSGPQPTSGGERGRYYVVSDSISQ